MTVRVAELESLFTADTRPLEGAILKVETRKKEIAKAAAEVKVTADNRGALTALDAVATGTRALPEGLVAVDGDPRSALAALERVSGETRGLPDGTVNVTADVSAAERSLKGLGSTAERASQDAGEGGGKAFLSGFVGGLASIPIVGAITGLIGDIGQAFSDGLQVEVRADRLMATTGLDARTAATLGRAAGEAYASNWGSSIEANFDVARVAVQTRLLDPKSTARDAEAIIASLNGVADVLGEDIPRVARSTAQLLRTGLAKDAQEAFDLIVKGQQAGLNVSEDLLDTLDEYSTQWRKLGLTGPQVLGLLSQGVRAGARDTDIAADALKEFSIRAIDGSATTAAGFKAIGLNAKDMAEQIAAGGPTAAAALDLTLDRLRSIEDPAARSAAAVELFGTQAEDMGQALYSMDLSNAVQQLGNVEGAAKSALETIGDNAAGDVETAKRNIEVAAQGIEGALAAAFNPQIEDFATWVSGNREQVMQFLLDIANGGLDAGRAFVNGMATATEAVGDFAAEGLTPVLATVADIVDGLASIGLVSRESADSFRAMAGNTILNLQDFQEGSKLAADAMRTELITNGIDPIQKRLNDVALPLVAEARMHDASVRMASALDGVGYAADGSKAQLELLNGELDTTTTGGKLVDEQLRSLVASMEDQTRASVAAGESQADFTARLQETRDGLVAQLEQMGLTHDQAVALADAYGAIPDSILTTVEAETAAAQNAIDRVITLNNGRKVTLKVDATGSVSYHINGTNLSFNHDGNIYDHGRLVAIANAAGGVHRSPFPHAPLVAR